MVERTFDFDAEYSDALIDDAARTFVRRLFRKYLWLLVGACIMNIIGFAAVVALLRTVDWMTVAIGVVAVLGPVYFPWQYFRLPAELAAPMKRVLVPSARVSVTPSSLTLSAKGRTFTRRWTDLKAIVECPDYFLLVVGLLAFTFVPRKHMPLEAQQVVREASTTMVQPNPSMQPTGQQRPAAD
jgi:hypothetical protein